MMDFNLILLLVGSGLLNLVAVFVLLGCFAGLKKELKCTAIAFVLLLLALLVFGNSSTLLDANGWLLKSFIKGIPDSAVSIWDCVLVLVQNAVPGGAEIFAEGTKSYAFLYSVVGGVARGALLIIGTFAMFIISMITLGIYRLVTRIKACKKARLRAAEGYKEPEPEVEGANENVLVTQGQAGEAEGTMITANKEPVVRKKSQHRVWAGALAGLRAIIVIFFLFAPVSGITSVLDSISPETEKVINEALGGNQQNTAAGDTILDIAIDFKDAYYDSALGKFVEGSQFFFGESFSTKLFDGAFKIDTDYNSIKVREEAIVIIEAVNKLEGNTKLDALTEVQVANVLDALKDSKLIVEAMPVAIEVAYYYPLNQNGSIKFMGTNESLKDFLFASNQQAAFLQLRQLDWDKNIEVLLDVVAEAYKLGFLEEDFNVLTMDPEVLRSTLAELAKSDAVNSILNIAIQVALKHEAVTNIVGPLPAANLSNFNWGQEYETIVSIYEDFQQFGITSLEGLDAKALIEDILNDEAKLETVVSLVEKVTELQLVNEVAYEAAIGYVSNIQLVKDSGADIVAQVKKLADLDWSKDINTYVEAVKLALPLIEIEEGLKIKADYLNLDAAVLETVMDTLLSTESFTEVLPIATNVALSLPAVQKILGKQEVVINTANVNWNKDFTSLVNIYRTFQELDIETLEQLTKDPLGLVKDIFAEKGKVESVNSLLAQLADLTLFTEIAAPVGNAAVGKIINDKAPKFGGLLDLTALSEEEWKNDFESLVAIAQNVYEICGFNFKTSQIDFVELSGPAGQETLELLFGLNLLGGNQNKTDLVAAALVQFKVLDQETVDELDFSNVVWLSEEEYSEVNVFKQLFALVARISKLEGVDLGNLKFDYNEILSRDDSYELIVDVLDVVVESELVLELLPSVLDKYVVPLVKNFEDEDGTLKDIITGLESEVLIAEIQKLVDVAKAVVELNVLEVSKSGIQALDLANTEAMKTAINGIFDSKLLEGYEARVVRILLKVTKLFPNLEKGIFAEVDFDREQALLIQVIEDLEVILQDENFLTFDENGKIKLDPLYFTKDAQLDALLSALKTLFGEYQGVTVSEGSALVEILLPQAFGKFVTPVIPEGFKGLMEILNIENQHPRTLAEDVRKVIYIAETLIDVKVQSYLEQKDYNFAGAAEAIQTVLSTVFDLGMIQGQEAEVIAWALNYVQQTAKLDVAEFTAKDFAGVDWDLEVEAINELIADLIKFTNNNKISSVKSLTNFIKEKGFLKDEFFTTHNYNVLFELIEDVFALQTVEQILPFGLEYALNIAKEKQIDVTFLGDNMTGELLVEDVKSIVEALKIAVYDVEILEYKKANWTGELPAVEQVVEILDIIMNLNVLDGKYNQLLSFAVNKFLPANNFIKASDFSFDTQYNFLEDWAIIKEVLPVVYDLIHANNITKIEEVKAFVTEKWFANTDLVKDYNLLLAADLLDLLSETQLVQQALVGVIKNAVKSEALTKIGNFASLQDLTKPELVSDIHTLTDVVRQAIDANVLQYYELHDLDPINYEAFAGILETVGKLNVINKCGAKILPEVVNYVLGKNDKLNIDYEFTQADFAVIDWATETELLGEVLVKVGALAESLNLDSLSDILLFINNKDFTNTIVVTEENINKVIEIADIAVDSKIIQAVAVAGVDFALDFAKTKGFDVTFLKGRLTGEELISDLNVIVEIAQNAVDFGAIEFLNTKNIEDINVDYVVEIVALLEQLNILTCAQPEWAAFVVGKVAPLLKLDVNPLVSDYNYIDYAAENELLQEVVKLAGELLDNVNIHSIEEIKAYISNKDFLNINTYNDRVIDNVQSLLLVAAESDLLGVHLVDLVEYAAKVGGNIAKLDLSFVNNVFTRSEIQEDLVTLVDIIDAVEEFGIVDLIFTGDVVINLDPVIEAVALLEELNLLNKTNDYIAELVFNMILPKLGLNKVHVDDFKAINFAAENAVLVSALEEVKVLLEAEGLEKVSDVVSFAKNKDFVSKEKYAEVYNDEAIASVERLVEIATTSELVKLELVPLFNMAISKVPSQFNVKFLKDSVTTDELVSDANVLVDIAKLAVEFGALDLIFTGDAEFNLDAAIEAVPLLEQLNIATKNNKEIAELVFNMILPALKLEKVSAADFENINFAAENAVLVNALEEVKVLCEVEGFDKVSEIIRFVKNREFLYIDKYEQVYSDEAILSVERLVEVATTSELVKLELVPLFNKAISLVPAQFDVQFLKDSVTADELANDLNVLVDIAKLAVDFGAVEYIFTKDIAEINVNYVAEAVALFEELNILTNNNKEIAAFAFNFVYEKLGINQNKRAAKVQAADFENINFASENAKLQEAIALIGEIKTELQLNSLSDVMNFVNNKEYANFEEFTALTYTHAEELIGVLVDTELAQYALPTVFDFALDKVAAKGLDFSYLSGQFTGAELANDVKVLVSEAVRWVRNNGIITAIKNKEIQANYVDELAITVRALKDVNIVNKEQAKLVTFITNALYKNVFKYSESIDESYFANVDWANEFDAVADVLVELGDIVETFGVEHNLLSLEGLKGFAQIAKDTTIYDQEFVANVADVLKAITKSDALLAEAQFGLEYAIAFASMKGIDATAIEVTNEELAADLVELSDVLVKVVDANVLGFALAGEALNQDKFAGLVEAVQAVLDLNIVQDIRTELLNFAFGKVGLVVEEDKLEAINWNEEIDVIGDLLYAANDALNTLEVYTLADIKGINVKEYLTINYQTNDILEAVAGLLEVAIESQLVETVLFPVSEKFLAAENLAGLGDLHNIYANFDEVAEDVEKVLAIIEAVVDLNVCSFVVEGSDIPYANTAAVEKILTNAFALNYLNNDGRLNQLISKFVKINTESIDFSQINLEADADKLVEAYKELLPILTDDKFFAKNKEDFKKVVINLKYWAKPLFTNALKDALVNVLDTTLVEETNGAIFLFTIPLLKKAAPDYYDAIDPESLTAEQLSEDFNEIIDLVELILSSNVSDLLAGKFFTAEGEEVVVAAIETLLNLNLLEGKFDDIANVTADRFDTKRIGSYYFDKAAYNLTDVQYEQDLETIIDIIGVAFDVLEDECLTTLKEVKGFFSNKRNVKGLLADQSQFAKLEEIAQLVLDLTIVKYNALPVYTEAFQPVVAKVIGAELADLAAVYDSSEELVAELEVILEAASLVEDFGAFEIIEGAEINYDQAALVKEILNKVASLEYLEANKQNLLEFVDSKVSQDLSQIDLTSMDLQNDFAILGEIYEQLIPVLVSKYNPFTTLDSIKKPELVKSDLYALIYDYQTIYPSVVVLASDISIAPQLVKFAVSKAKLSGKVAEYVDVLAIADMSDAEIREDLVVFADILTHAINLDVLAKVLYKEDIAITDNTTISALAASAFELNMVDNNFVELLEKVLTEIVKIDLTNVDLAAIDAEAEQALLVDLVADLVVVLNELGVEKLSQVKPYVTDTVALVKEDVQEAKDFMNNKDYAHALVALLETIKAEDGKVSKDAKLAVFDHICESQLLVKLALPVYEQKVYSHLDGVVAILGDLSNYNEALLAEDLGLFNAIVHDIYESSLDQVAATGQLPDETCIPYLENILRNVAKLNLVDVKVADVLEVAQVILDQTGLTANLAQLCPEFDLANINASSISFKADAEIYASMAQYLYVALDGLYEAKFDAPFFGNTAAVSALVEIYTISLDTTLVNVIAPEVHKIVTAFGSQLGMPVNENVREVLENVADFLFGAIELGVFSNDGIDLTDAATIEIMKQSVFNTVKLPAVIEEVVNKVCRRAYAYDVVPFDWNQVSIAHELQVYMALANQVMNFVQNNGQVLATDLSILTNPSVQADLTQMANKVAESSFVQQLFFPFVEGTFKALTLSYTDGEMTYNATLDDVLAYSLPNFFRVVNAAYELTEFNPAAITVENILANLDAVAEIVEVFGTDIMLKDNVAKIFTTVLGALTTYDLTAEQAAKLQAIDFANEVQYSNKFFEILADTYAAHPFTLGVDMLKDKEVILGVADALEAVLPSETVKVLARTVLDIVNEKIASSILPEASTLAASRLDDPTFTDELIVADLYILVDVLRNAANSGILENTTDFAQWNFAAIKAIVADLFATNLANGYEEEFSKACIVKVPVVNGYYDPSMVIADWEVEIITILNAIESLVNDGVTDMNNLSVDNLSGATVEYICDSVILSDILVDTVNEKLEALGVADYYVATQAKLNAVADWDAELAAIKDLNNLLDSLNNGTYVLADVVAKYENIKANTVLVNDILTSSAEYMVPKMPIVKDYYESSMVIADWSVELDAIVNAIKTLDSMGLDVMESPIENLTGDAVLAAVSSEILKAAFVEEFNANLVSLGLGTYYTVTETEVEAIQTAGQWDKELDTIQSLQAVVEKINNATVTPADLLAVKAEADQTQIAKDIFASVLTANGIVI